jgi:hypothetical protein
VSQLLLALFAHLPAEQVVVQVVPSKKYPFLQAEHADTAVDVQLRQKAWQSTQVVPEINYPDGQVFTH